MSTTRFLCGSNAERASNGYALLPEVRTMEYEKADRLLISGPCVLESVSTARSIAESTLEILERRGISLRYVFKASFDKANRTSLASYRGPGIDEGLTMLDKIKREFEVEVTSDIHTPQQARIASGVLDIVQIPAFLCRQTDMVTEAGRHFSEVNVKKGQFLPPDSASHIVEKASSLGTPLVYITERGSSFGPANLVVDYRSLKDISAIAPTIFDATHSIQRFDAGRSTTTGDISYLPSLAKAAVATGHLSGLFIETHPSPLSAKCDRHSMWPLNRLENLLVDLCEIWDIVDEQEERNTSSAVDASSQGDGVAKHREPSLDLPPQQPRGVG